MDTLARQKIAQALATLQPHELWLFFTQEGSDPSVPLVFDTALSGRAALMLHPARGSLALCANYDRGHLEHQGQFDEIRAYTTDFAEAFCGWLAELAPQTVLINFSEHDPLADGLTYGQYLVLERLIHRVLPQATLESSQTRLGTVRGVKTPEELRRLQQAIDRTITFYDRLLPTLHAGQTERQIQARMNDLAAELGTTPYLGGHGGPLVCLNRVGLAHRGPTDEALQPGDLLILDTGLGVDGYFSDIARTCYVRAPGEDAAPSELQAVFQAIYGAIDAAFGALKPGVQGVEVDAAARAALRQAGQPELSHATGHQIGRHVHDGGTLLGPAWERYGAAPQGTVKAGEVYTLEPTVVQSPLPSMIVEENVVVTQTGARWLSRRQEQLWLI
ncbi:M24 family metallopeptidase [Deinococcus marmoris]|uniref:Aminopeptidase YpdF (MP-, MA-, MS-, AP-, NP-specific) n=1 Tax=Deinococcus marmoris TaxID=249408 RepID=A0A1U7NVH9_9DEIO|nr:M24 family metallopeptidase [Deinococcus marmoris]OLV16925.1 Aminopeptidase YpdF (MP-, MA-, MS-, AP-, NP- specific) [Deinococcus marmoris]